jgi:hypothetical protein
VLLLGVRGSLLDGLLDMNNPLTSRESSKTKYGLTSITAYITYGHPIKTSVMLIEQILTLL